LGTLFRFWSYRRFVFRPTVDEEPAVDEKPPADEEPPRESVPSPVPRL
jgi:hypothetical protein